MQNDLLSGDSYSPECQNRLEHLLTPEDVADILKLGKKAVLRLVKQNEIPYIRIGRHVRFSMPALNAWINSGKKNEDGKNLLTLEQAAKRLGVCRLTVQRLIYKNEIGFMKIGKRQYRFKPEEIEEYIEKRYTNDKFKQKAKINYLKA
jgi:excisionase family DNA binding protein